MTEHLQQRLAALEERVRVAVERRSADDPKPDDPFRGLYLSHDRVTQLLETQPGSAAGDPVAAVADSAASTGDAVGDGNERRLDNMRRAFGIDLTDTELLLIALAPDIDPRFEQFYGYLNDDVTRRRATVGLALELCGLSTADHEARRRLSTGGRLARCGLVLIEERDRPVLARALRVPDRIGAHLLGDDAFDADLEALLSQGAAPDMRSASVALARGIALGSRLGYVLEVAGSSAAASALAAVALTGARPLTLDLGRLVTAGDAGDLTARAVVEARLRGAVLIAGPIDALVERSPNAIRDLADSDWPVVLFGERAWEPRWARSVPLQVEAPVPDRAHRARLWQAAIEGRPGGPHNGRVGELVQATSIFHLSPPQIERAAESALLSALAQDRELSERDLQAGARRQNAAGLERLAHRIEPAASWDDLIVPADVGRQLRELAGRARQRDRVLGEWQIGGRSSRGRGITTLFAGESGTGKTLSAEVIAHDLGLDLYVIDLSTVVDKYIGETEKNLDRIFSEADRINGVLLFDEADAIFGKRSEVRDARDRYANVEVAYLLQRMERFDGLAVLTTNLRSNIDESFTRRIDVIVDFPKPDEAARLALWHIHLPDQLPQAADLDLEFLAERFTLAGGDIRNICLTAAYLAADGGTPVRMLDLIRATGREYRKLGRLTTESEFGRYHAMLSAREALVG